MKNKIGLGVITCNKPDRLAQSIKTVPGDDYIDCLVIVNDGEPYDNSLYPKGAHVIQHETNKCVGPSKNDALRYLIDQGCSHLFIMEDDILIKDPGVFTQYIKTAQATGIWHLNYGYHGPANKDADDRPNPRCIIEYRDGIKIALNQHIVGAFSYYYKGVIDNRGYIDEQYNNAWDHVDHTYQIIKAGLHPPFWWFADTSNSCEYLEDLDSDLSDSSIRQNQDEWISNLKEGAEHYKRKHGWIPVQTPQADIQQVQAELRNISAKYSREVL